MKVSQVIVTLRKERGWAQAELAVQTGVSQVMIGKFERGEAIPSFEVAKKIADTFEGSLDYLVGEGRMASYDKEVLRRIEDIQNLDSDTRSKLFFLIDNVVQNFKTRQAFAQ